MVNSDPSGLYTFGPANPRKWNKGLCKELRDKIDKNIAWLERKLREYKPEEDYVGCQRGGGKYGTTKPGSHYEQITGKQRQLEAMWKLYNDMCGNDDDGNRKVKDYVLVPIPAEAWEMIRRWIASPGPKPSDEPGLKEDWCFYTVFVPWCKAACGAKNLVGGLIGACRSTLCPAY